MQRWQCMPAEETAANNSLLQVAAAAIRCGRTFKAPHTERGVASYSG